MNKAEQEAFDFIAVATYGRGGLQHWVMGSVTGRVLGATKLPILIVRPEAANLKQVSSKEGATKSKLLVEPTSF